MNNTKKIVIIFTSIFLGAVIIVATILGIFFIGKNGVSGLSNIFGTNVNVNESKVIDLSGITAVNVECASGDIHVVESDSPNVTLKGYVITPKPREQYLSVSTEGSALYIKVEYDSLMFNVAHLDLTVSLPRENNFGASVNCASGNIDVTGIKFTNMSVTDTSGNLHITDCTSEKLDSNVTSGNTDITSCSFGSIKHICTSGNTTIRGTAGSMDVRNTSGNINVSDASSGLNLYSSSGEITADMTKIAQVTAEVTSGNIRLYVPRDSAFDLIAKVASGNITSDMDIAVSGSLSRSFVGDNVSGKCNGGGVSVNLSAMSGNITINGK